MHISTSPRLATLAVATLFTAAASAQVVDARYGALDATIDPALSTIPGPATRVLTLPGIGVDFRWEVGGHLVQFDDGTATVTGTVRSASNPSAELAVDLRFDGLVEPGNPAHPPAGSPKLELVPSAYVGNGGTIDPSTWTYYTNTTGVLTGLGSLDGAVINLTRLGPSLQIGDGANGYNLSFGASAWFNVSIVSQPTSGSISTAGFGDMNTDLGYDCFTIATSPLGDQFKTIQTNLTAVWLPPVGDFWFVREGSWVELPDGTALLTGVVASQTNIDDCFNLDVKFRGRIDPGQPGYPPAGSPKLQLTPNAYVPMGVVDPSTWTYYTEFDGVLTGCKNFEGALVKFVRRGEAFQVGTGASNYNIQFGAGSWFTATVCRQPNSGPPLPSPIDGDINFNLGNPCVGDASLSGTPCQQQLSGHLAERNNELWLTVQLQNAPVTPLSFWLVGAGGVDLPLPGGACRLLTDAPFAVPAPVSSAGMTCRDVEVPLVPFGFTVQHLAIDQGAWTTSNAVDVVITP